MEDWKPKDLKGGPWGEAFFVEDMTNEGLKRREFVKATPRYVENYVKHHMDLGSVPLIEEWDAGGTRRRCLKFEKAEYAVRISGEFVEYQGARLPKFVRKHAGYF